MRKIIKSTEIILIIITMFLLGNLNISYAANNKVIDSKTESTLVEIKNDELKTIEDYQEKNMALQHMEQQHIYCIYCKYGAYLSVS